MTEDSRTPKNSAYEESLRKETEHSSKYKKRLEEEFINKVGPDSPLADFVRGRRENEERTFDQNFKVTKPQDTELLRFKGSKLPVPKTITNKPEDTELLRFRKQNTSPETEVEDDKAVINFEDNILSKSATNTYKFTWFACSPSMFNTKDVRKLRENLETNRVVIAESGNSGKFFINNVTMSAAVASSVKLKSTQHTSFEITVYEPMGFSLMDSLLAACDTLGMPNYMFAPYYLQLEFLEYNEDGVPRVVDTATRIWSIKINNMTTNMDTAGTTYNISAQEYEYLAYSNHAAVTDTNFIIQCDTVGSFFKKLQQAMNEEKQDQLGFAREFPDEIRFEVSPEIAELPIKSSEEMKYSPKNQDDTRFWQSKNMINVPKGSGIEALMSNLMVSNQTWAKRYLNYSNINERSRDDDYLKIWMLDVNIELKEFDYFAGDFSKVYIYKIKPYTVVRQSPSLSDTADVFHDTAKQTARIKKIAKTFALNKKYEYMYTGKNTEVLNMDVAMDFLWVSHVPIYKGLHLNNARTSGPEVRPNAETLENLSRDLKTYNRQARTAIDPSTYQEANNNRERVLNQLDSFRRMTGGVTREDADRMRDNAAKAAEKFRNNGEMYVEDLFIDKREKSEKTYPQVSKPLPTTVVTDGNYAGSEFAKMTDGTVDNYRSIAATLLNSIHNPDLMQVNLGIRGDPYWIPLSRTEARLKIWSGEYIDSFEKDNMYMLRFRFPIIGDDDGLQRAAVSPVVSGLYYVTKIVSTFANGLFTQELSSYRETNTNILVARGIKFTDE